MALSGQEEERLRSEISRRIERYAEMGLKTENMREILERDGPLRLLEHYSTSDPDHVQGWKALVQDEPEMALEWLLLNDAAARREASPAAREAATWKLSKPA